ncbi:hypothetical protein EYC80_001316 [Monilinia laxa]|uniref:GEgh 16 protein n=1 Tax=Monilinia laxa TaxID=61186 RepID=A0A5N6K925_MONLA|nr:hypothetical protein EYC80_001316 [Monilinia laxa]
MTSLKHLLLITSTLLSTIQAQGILLSAQGTKGSPASLPLQVQLNTNDANIINADEISKNIVNECGRTLLNGNIDIGENTETQLAAKTVTSVTKGSTVNVVMQKGGANGVGPYTCDMDQTSNAQATGQTKLAVKETEGKGGNISLAVTMPANMSCIGASTGNICTIRCFNNAAAGPFGGCFAVMQTDETASENTPGTIATEQTLEGIEAQVLQNNKDFPSAVKANSEATLGEQGLFAVEALLSSSLAPVATKAVANGVAAATGASGTAVTRTVTGTGRKGGNRNGGNRVVKNGGNAGNAGNGRNANANAKNGRAFMA